MGNLCCPIKSDFMLHLFPIIMNIFSLCCAVIQFSLRRGVIAVHIHCGCVVKLPMSSVWTEWKRSSRRNECESESGHKFWVAIRRFCAAEEEKQKKNARKICVINWTLTILVINLKIYVPLICCRAVGVDANIHRTQTHPLKKLAMAEKREKRKRTLEEQVLLNHISITSKYWKPKHCLQRCFIALCYRFVVVYGIYDDIRVIQSQMNCLCVEPHCHWNMMFAEYHGFMWESRTLEPNTQNQHSHTPNSHYRFDKTKSMTKFVHEHWTMNMTLNYHCHRFIFCDTRAKLHVTMFNKWMNDSSQNWKWETQCSHNLWNS